MTAATPKLTVVVADDDPGLRALLRLMLEQGGYHAEAFENGRLAWERLQKGGVDLVVLDVNMPEMDGIEVTRRIRSDAKLKKLPILMLTVRALVEEQVRGYEGGADDYLTKPFNHDILLARLRALSRRTGGS